MSVSGPSPLGTLMVQRVEAALGVTGAQQANVATGARPDAVTQPGQPDKADPTKNPPPKEHEGARRAEGQGERQAGLAQLARNNPEIAKLLAARNAPMTSFTASAPTSLGQAAKTILALLQQFPDAKPAVTGRAPLLSHSPGQGSAAGQGAATGASGAPATATPVGGNLDPRAVEALMQRAGGGNAPQATAASAANAARGATLAGTPQAGTSLPGQPGVIAPGMAAGAPSLGGLLLPSGMAGQLAMALSQAMQGSGLFYESHLRDFTFGQRSLAQMQSEPQAQAGREAARGASPDAPQARGGEATQGQAASSGQTAQAGQAAAQQSAHLAGALLSMDPTTHGLVRQQLETLANQTFAWQGEAWPGGELEWEVRRRDPQEGHEDAQSWSTQLKLKLPGMGEIVARLSLSENQLVMHLNAPDSAGLMTEHTGRLRERLGLHGLQLSQLSISRDELPNGGSPA